MCHLLLKLLIAVCQYQWRMGCCWYREHLKVSHSFGSLMYSCSLISLPLYILSNLISTYVLAVLLIYLYVLTNFCSPLACIIVECHSPNSLISSSLSVPTTYWALLMNTILLYNLVKTRFWIYFGRYIVYRYIQLYTVEIPLLTFWNKSLLLKTTSCSLLSPYLQYSYTCVHIRYSCKLISKRTY